MRWKGGRRSQNVEDRRGGGGAVKLGAGLGLGTIIIALIVALMGGGDISKVMEQVLGAAQQSAQQGGSAGAEAGGEVVSSPEEEELKEFISVVLGDTEDVWTQLFAQMGRRYEAPTLVLFRDGVRSACGVQSAQVGPFYCPADRNAYIDLGFYEQLRDRFKAPGDFAQAYVLAHEVGHHVQNLLGTSDQVHSQRRRVSEVEANALSVRMELQADFYAGVWAHHAQRARNILEEGDVEEALNAASRIGDDNLQKQAQGYTSPDSFTHGTSEQRMRWFAKGLRTGDLSQGDTFSISEREL